MRIGAIGAPMATPYIYNTNRVSRTSMNRVSPIGDDLLASKTDFSELAEEGNVNPLMQGQTKDFAGIYDKQIQMAKQNATRLGFEEVAAALT